MRISGPSHSTVVAYLALFAALGGTAIAARDDVGAKELKKPTIRERSIAVDAGGENVQVAASCKDRELLLSGAAGWGSDSGPDTAVVSIDLNGRTVSAIGTALNQPNTFTTQAVCLPR